MNMPASREAQLESEALTPAEAAYVAAVSRKTVDQAIDRGEITPAPTRGPNDTPRQITISSVIYLRLREEAGLYLSAQGKRRLYQKLSKLTLEEIPATIDLGAVGVATSPALERVQRSLEELRATQRFVVTDPEIRGGEPVVRATRIPVHQLAEMVEHGEERERILAAYPALTTESLDAALLYARLHRRRGRPRTAPRREHALERVLTPAARSWTTVEMGPRARERSHAWLDDRSRALHTRIAEKLRENPALIAIALENIARWEERSGPDKALDEWRRILTSKPLSDVTALLMEDSENADRLRQSTPFAGVLTEEERAAIFRAYEAL
jgi:uncharacterized protein (DUF433 family)